MAPAVEQFETRQLLTGGMPITFVVNTLNDTIDANPNITSLREAVLQANAQTERDVIIQLQAGTHTLTINGPGEDAAATGDLDLSSAVSVTIRGKANGTSVIAANFSSADRVFDIASGKFVTIEGVTIKDGLRDSGGAIDNAGQLTVVRTTFFNNRGDTGTDPVRGGAIHNAAGASLFVLASTFNNNTTTGEGGAIYNAGFATVDASTFFNNGAIGSGNNHGGAIYNASNGTLNVQRSTFEANTAGVGAGSGDGGAIFTAGSAAIDHSTFSANLADNGGAIEVASGGSLFLTASTVTLNTALLGGGIDFNGSSNAALVQNTIIAQNTATGDAKFSDVRRGANNFTSLGFNLIGIGPSPGLGFTNGSNGDQVGTTTTPIGPMLGALALNGGPTKTHLPLGGSTAINAGMLPNVIGSALPITDQRGAPLRAPLVADIGAVETGTNAVFVNTLNDAPDANLNDGVVDADLGTPGNQISLRAALHQHNFSGIAPVIVVLPGVFLLDKTGPDDGSGSAGDLDVFRDTEIIGFGPLATIIDANGIDRVFDLPISNTLVESLTVQHGFTATEMGGGIRNSGRTTLNNVHIRENRALSGGGIFSTSELNLDGVFIADNIAAKEGGGIANEGRATIRNSFIVRNSAGDSAGGIRHVSSVASAGGISHVSSFALLEIDSSTIRDNTTNGDAGGIGSEGMLIIRDSNITGNSAVLRAGGIGSRGNTTLIRSNVDGNFAGSDAGGIGAESGTLVISASFLTNNTAGADGGGLGIIGSTNATVNFSEIAGNRALSGAGGGVFVGGGTAKIGNSAIVNNMAGKTGVSFGDGGGLFVTGGTTDLSNSTVSGNTAIRFNNSGGQGGGVTQAGGTLSVNHATITNNTAALGGGLATIVPSPSPSPSGGTLFLFSPSEPGRGTVKNTIIAKNMDSVSGASGSDDVFAATNIVGSLGHNLIGVAGTGSGGPIFVHNVNSDKVGTSVGPIDPRLGALLKNSGLTVSHALLAGSPAIDASSTTMSVASEQRGAPRVIHGGTSNTADIGASEFGFNGIFVNTTQDTINAGDGLTSLREAIIQANGTAGTQTIVLLAGVYRLTRTGPGEDSAATGDLDITDDVNIRGYGAESTTIDGLNSDRLFDVFSGASRTDLVLSDLTLTHGKLVAVTGTGNEIRGGAIRSIGSHLELHRVQVTNNFASGFGGAIYAQDGDPGSTVIAKDSVFLNNTSGESGGAIAVVNNLLELTNTRFEFNTALGSGGALLIANSFATVQGSLFFNNTGESGGAVYVDTFGQPRKTVSFSHSQFSNNFGLFGGGIANFSQTLAIANSVFQQNSANNGGGGLYNFNGLATIDNTDFLFNQIFNSNSNGNGGAIANAGSAAMLTLRESTLASGNAPNGGGLHNAASATAFIFKSTISQNFGLAGGGISNAGTLTIINSTISGNLGSSGAGGLHNTSTGTATITNATFALNTSLDGGGIRNDNTASNAVTLQNTLVATNSTFSNNPNADLSGSFTSGGNNLIGDRDGATGFTNGSNGDIVGGITSVVVMNATATATSPIEITASPHNLQTGDRVRVTGVNGLLAANGNFTVTVTSTTTFTLNGTFGNGGGTYTSGGQVFELVNPRLGALRDNNLSRFAPPLAPAQFGNLPPVVTLTPQRSTFTHELLVGSPAIDVGSDAVRIPLRDQRGELRVDVAGAGTTVTDIGAFELAHTTVSGIAFSDDNGNGMFAVGTEMRRPDLTVFVDANGNGRQDDFEPFADVANPGTPQDEFGTYTLELVSPGQQVIGHTVPFNTRPTAPNDPRLSSPSSVASGNTPRSVVTADFNNDGRLDFAFADASANAVVISQRGHEFPVAGFVAQTIAVGLMPVDVAASDIDLDGRVDLVVANFNSDTLTVLFNLGNDAFGNAQFGGAVTLAAGDGPTSLVIADLNQDSKPDIAVTNRNSNNVFVFANTGSRTFAGGAGFGVSSDPRQMVAADFDGDGLTDLAVAAEDTNSVVFLFNFSTPSGFNFNSGTSVSFSAGTLPRSLVAEDFGQDGDFDLVVGGSSELFRVSNLGNRNFSVPSSIVTFATPTDLAAVDIDGDGDKDVVAVSETTHVVGVLKFENGTFVSLTNLPTGAAPTGIAVGEFSIGESYSRPDILTANSGGGSVTLLTNLLGSAVIAGVVGMPTENLAFGVQPLATIRGNVFNDLKLAGSQGSSFGSGPGLPNVSVFLDTNGNGRFDSSFEPAALSAGFGFGHMFPGDYEFRNLIPGTYRVIPLPPFNSIVTSPAIAPADSVLIDTVAGATPADILVDDVDLDGRKDLLVLRRFASTSEFLVLRNTGSGYSQLSSITFAGQALRLALGDFDADGDKDVVITRDPSTSAGDGAVEFIRNGRTSFTSVGSFSLNELPTDIAVGDVNGDMKPDIVVSTLSATQSVTILAHATGFTFTSATLAAGTEVRGVALADFDNDNDLDLVASDSANDRFKVFGNNGSGTFSEASTTMTDDAPGRVYVSDLAGTAALDIVVTSRINPSLGSSISIHVGVGTLAFNFATLTPFVDGIVVDLAAVDYDQDGLKDIVIAENNGVISVLRGFANGVFLSPESLAITPANSSFVMFDLGEFDGAGTVPFLDIAAVSRDTFTSTEVRLGLTRLNSQLVTVKAGDTIGGLNFGVVETATLQGVTFYDLDADGRQDPGEPPQPFVTVFVDRNLNGALDPFEPMTVSAMNGTYSLTGVRPQDMSIVRVMVDSTFTPTGPINAQFPRAITFSGVGSQSSPSSDLVAVGDLDNDGDDDIVRANPNNDSISVFRFDQLTGTHDRFDILVGDNPSAVLIGNITGTGAAEIYVLNRGSDTVSVFENNFSTGFALIATLPAGDNPGTLALFDFTGNSTPELAITSTADGSVRFYQNNGTTGKLEPAGMVTVTQASAGNDLSFGDFDGDNDIDFALLDTSNKKVVFVRNNGGGAVSFLQSVTVGTQPVALSAGFNIENDNDLDLDFAVANAGDGTFQILRNDNGTFVAETAIAVGGTPSDIEIRYVDDGVIPLSSVIRADVVVTLSDRNFIPIFERIGVNQFTSPNFAVVSGPQDSLALGQVAARTGKPDIVTSLPGTGAVSLSVNRSSDTPFTFLVNAYAGEIVTGLNFANTPAPGEVRGVKYDDLNENGFFDSGEPRIAGVTVFLDLDNDDLLDVGEPFTITLSDGSYILPVANTVASYTVSEVVPVGYLQTGPRDLNFAPSSVPGAFDASALAAADLNGDGRVDLISAKKTGNVLSVFLRNADGSYAAPTTLTVGNSPSAVLAIDVDNDTDIDLVAANADSNNVSVLINNGSGTFAAAVNYAVGTSPTDLRAGFFNSDSFLDLVTANAGSNNVSILRNQGNGTFGPATNLSVGAGSVPGGVAVGDFDNDTDLDLAVTRTGVGFNDLQVLTNNGMGTFSTGVVIGLAASLKPVRPIAADFNGDGRTDLAVPGQDSNNVAILLANPAGGFFAPVFRAVGKTPEFATAVDLNQDGKLDLVVSNTVDGTVSVLLNEGVGNFNTPAANFAAGPDAGQVVPLFLNGDANPDLAVTSFANNSIVLLTNTYLSKRVFVNAGATVLNQNFGNVPDTHITLDGNDLRITDRFGDGSPDLITLRTTASKIIISSPTPLVVNIAGASGSGTNEVQVPLSTFTGMIIADLRGGADTLQIDFTSGNFTRAIQYFGGEPRTGSGDTLVLFGGGTFATATFNANGFDSGTINIAGNSTISYTGLEPIQSLITAANVTLNYSSENELIVVTSAGSGRLSVDSNFAEVVTFNNPTESLTINSGAGNDTISAGNFDVDFSASLTLDGQSGQDTISLGADLLLGSATSQGNLTISAEFIEIRASSIRTDGDTTNHDAGSVTFNGAVQLVRDLRIDSNSNNSATDGAVTFTGTINGNQALTIDAGNGIATFGGHIGETTPLSDFDIATAGQTNLNGNLSTDGGSVTLGSSLVLGTSVTIDTEQGNDSAAGTVLVGQISASAANVDLIIDTGTAGANAGDMTIGGFGNSGGSAVRHVTLRGLNLTSGTDGNVTLNGSSALASGGDFRIEAGTLTLSTGASAAVSGAGRILFFLKRNVALASGSSITSVDGAITIQANVGTLVSGDFTGISLDGATIRTTGDGTEMTLTGRSGNASDGQYGIRLTNNSVVETTGSARIFLIGTSFGAGGSNNDGVNIASGSDVMTASANISLQGFRGSESSSEGIDIQNDNGTSVTSTNGTISFAANTIAIGETQPTIAGRAVQFRRRTGVTAFNVGTASSTTLGLSDAQLDRVSTREISLGDIAGGDTTVSAAISRNSATSLRFSADFDQDLIFSGATASLDTNGGNVSVSLPPSGDGQIISGDAATDITANDVQLNSGTGGIGASGNPLTMNANSIRTNSSNANQFLSEANSVTILSAGLVAGTGTITLSSGTFLTTSTGSITSAAIVGNGATLGGTGTTAAVTVQSGGTVAPGSSPGILNTGDVSFTSGSKFRVEIAGGDGAGDSNGHDQLNVTGTVSLGGATLSTSGTITSSPGQTLVLINNDGTDAISGTFNGLADGATVTINTVNFLISYFGGSGGNDVTLTQAGASLTFADNDGAADTFTIRRAGNTTQVLNGSTVLNGVPTAAISGLTINGEASQDDSLVVDFTGGNPLPASGVTFNGGTAGNDSLSLIGGTVASVTHTFTNANDGSVAINGSTAVNYTGLEPITDNLSATDRVFTFNGGAETITLTDAAGANMTIDSTQSESVTFANPIGSLTINAGTDNDTITISSLDAAYTGHLQVVGGSGNDALSVATSLTLQGDVTLQSETITLNGDVILDGGTVGHSAIFEGNLVLGANITIDTDVATPGNTDGAFVVSGSINGAHRLTVFSGDGLKNISSVGNVTPLTALTLAGAFASQVTLNGDIFVDGNIVIGNSKLLLTGSRVIDSEQGNNGPAGHIQLLGELSATASGVDLLLDASTTASGQNDGFLNLLSAGNSGGFYLNDVTFSTGTGAGGTPGYIDVRNAWLFDNDRADAASLTVQGGGDLITKSGITIDTEQGDDGPGGDVDLGTSNWSAIGTNVNVVINTTTGGTNASGNITLGGFNSSAGNLVRNLTANAANVGTGAAGNVTFTSAVALGDGGHLDIDGQTISLSSTSSDITLTGSSSASFDATRNISLTTGASVSSANGNITLNANAAGTTAGNFIGINVDGAALTSTNGNLSLTGRGGDSGTNNRGVQLRNAGANVSTSGTGIITLTGTGGSGGSGNTSHVGVVVGTSSQMSAVNGAINITGTSLATTGLNQGVVVNGSLTSTGSAPITINGTGASGTELNFGVAISQFSSVVTSGSGPVSITAQGGNGTGSTNIGALFDSGGFINSTGTSAATITVNGTGGTGTSNNQGFRISGGGSFIRSSNANISITGAGRGTGTNNEGFLIGGGLGALESTGAGAVSIVATTTSTNSVAMRLATNAEIKTSTSNSSISIAADSAAIAATSTITAGTSGTIAIRQATTGTAINLDSAVVSNTVTAGTLNIGNTNSGSITITDTLTRTAATNITLTTAGDNSLAFSGANGSLDANGGDVTIALDRSGLGSVLSGTAATDIFADSLSITNGSGGIGANGNPLTFNATDLTTNTATGNGSQFLSEVNSVSVLGLTAGTGTVRLNSGTFQTSNSGVIADATSLSLGHQATLVLNNHDEAISALTLEIGTSNGADVTTGTGTLTLGGDVTLTTINLGAIGATITGKLNLGSTTRTVSVADGNTTNELTIAANISGNAVGLTKMGAGNLTLAGTNTYTGATTVSGGSLSLDGSITSNTTVDNGATLNGTGTIASGNSLTVQNGGTIAPGTSPGILNTGNVTLQSGSTFRVELNGTSLGTDYDQLNVTGTVTIGENVTLIATRGFTPNAGDTFVIINNDGTEAIKGRFNGLPQGALLTIGGQKFHITYFHNSGDRNANDVALIANRPPVVNDQMFSISENNANGAAVGTVLATDADAALATIGGGVILIGSSPLTYAITSGNTNNVFAIDANSGQITVNNDLAVDFERNPLFNLTVEVTDDAGATDTATISVGVTNVAPSVPVDANRAPNRVSERNLNGTPVGITASSSDIHGGLVTYTFNSVTDSANGRFAVGLHTGIVTLADATLINPVTTYSITVRASDGTDSSSQTFTIAAFFETPNTPVDVDTSADVATTSGMILSNGSIPEDAPEGSRVGITVFALDRQDDEVFYVLTDDAGGRFAIDPQTGVVTVKRTSLLGRPSNPAQHTILTRASDAKGNATPDVPFVINVTAVPDNSPPVVSILPTRVDVVEGDSGLNFVTFIAKLNKTSKQTVTIDFTTRRGDDATFQLPEGIGLNAVFASDGSATTDPLGPRDFFRSAGRLTFDPGVDEQVVTVQIRPDTIMEPNEFFFVQLRLPPVNLVAANATLAPRQSVAIARILDDDATPQLIISNTEVLEGDTPNQNQLVFRVELVGDLLLDSNRLPLPTTVDFSTGNPVIDTAIADTAFADYTARSGTLTFTNSTRVQLITVNVLGDIRNEADETVSLRFDNAINLGLPRSAVTGTIFNDDDPQVVLSITPDPVDLTAVVEGDAGIRQPITFTVTLVGKATNVVTVDYSTVNLPNSAVAGSDYAATSGTLTFGLGEVTKTFTVMVSGDADVEEDEAFQVVLSLPSSPTQTNVSIDPDLTSSTIVIRNDDQTLLTEDGNALTELLNDIFDDRSPGGNNGGKSAAAVAAFVLQAQAFIAANGLTNYILIVIDPVDFILTDPQNRSSGFTESTGIVNQIPGAFYSGDGNVEVLVVPLPPAGIYNVQLVGIGGDFHGSITVVEGNQTTTTTVSQSLNTDLATVAVQVGNSNANAPIPVGLGLAAANSGNNSFFGVVGAFGQPDFNSLVAQLFQNLPFGFLDELNPPQTLTEEEIQERAAKLLEKLDKNNDNLITADEVEEEDWKTLLQSDKNADGKITLEELQDQIRANANSRPKSPVPLNNGPRPPQQNQPQNPQGNREGTKAKPTTFERNRATPASPSKNDKSSPPPAQQDAGKGQGKTTQISRPGNDDSRQANASRPWWHLFLPWSEKNSTNSRDTRNV